jgi:predicted ester cyclase
MTSPRDRRLGMGDLRKLVEKAFELTDRGEIAARAELMAPDVDFSVPGFPGTGREGTIAYSTPMVAAFSAMCHEITLAVEAGDTIAVEGVWTATHTGPLVTPEGEVPPTGRSLRLSYAAVFRVRDGLFSYLHVHLDRLEFMAQLGLSPQPAAV